MSNTKVLKRSSNGISAGKKNLKRFKCPMANRLISPKPRLKLFLEEVVGENGESSVAMDQGQAMSNVSSSPSLSEMSPGSVVTSDMSVAAASLLESLIGFSGLSQCKDPGGAGLPLGR